MPGSRYLPGVEAGISGCLSSADMDLEVPIEFLQGTQALSREESCKFAFLSSGDGYVREFLIWIKGVKDP